MALEKQYGQLILVQHGVKGMKWGQRRRAVKASNNRAKEWNKKYVNRSSMSTKDLKKNVERLNLENQFRDAVIKSNSASQSAGKKWLSNVGNSILKTTMSNLATTGINMGIEAAKKQMVSKGSAAIKNKIFNQG